MMAERGLPLAHTTIMRWVCHYAPEFERRWNRFSRPAGASRRMDETYIEVRGEWVYLYRAVDATGWTVDFRLSRRRDVVAAKAFFRKALKRQGSAPRSITLDGYAASHRAVREMKAAGDLPEVVKLRSSKYLRLLSGSGVVVAECLYEGSGGEISEGARLGVRAFKGSLVTWLYLNWSIW